jgi:hypothetical protein
MNNVHLLSSILQNLDFKEKFYFAHFRTTVCQKVSATEISTFYNYINQSHNSYQILIDELFFDWLEYF